MASRISWTRATLTSLSLFCRFDKWRAAALKSTLPLLPAVVAEDTLAPAASFRPLAIGLAVGPFNEGEGIFKTPSGRSEERSVGKGGVGTCRSRGALNHEKKT